MDAEYLKENVGDALTAALTSLAIKQPKDSLGFIGQYLINYADFLEAEGKREELKKSLAAKLIELHDLEESKKEEINKLELVAREKKDEEDKLIESLGATNAPEAIFMGVLTGAKRATGATSVYIGKKLETAEEEAPQIKYVAATPGNEFLVNQTLKGPLPDAEETEGQETVTFRLYSELPPAPVVEEEEQDEDAAPPPPAFPEYVHIENVIREPAIKYFGIPKLGAYLVVPIKYNTGLHDEGITVYTPPPPPEAAEGEEGEEGEETPEEGDKEVSITPPVEPPKLGPGGMIMVPKVVQYILALDSMGQARKFTPEQIQEAQKWAKLLASNLERAELELFNEELVRVDAIQEKEKQLRTVKVPEIKEKLKEALKDFESQEESTTKKLQEKTSSFQLYKDAIIAEREYILSLSTLIIKPKGNLFKVLEAVLTLLQSPKKEVASWDSMRGLLASQFWERIEVFDPSSASTLPSREDIENLKSLLEGIFDTEQEAANYECWVLHQWFTSALELIESIHDKREADAAAAEAAAEAEEEEPAE